MKRSLNVAHLLASNFFGGPEKQLVEHGLRIQGELIVPQIYSFREGGRPNALLTRAGAAGLVTGEIRSRGALDPGVVGEVLSVIRRRKIDLLCVHGYKANVTGRLAAWRAGIPVIAISRGWTGEGAKVRCYEWLDRQFLRLADHVVAVSWGQQEKIVRLGIDPGRVSVIHNAINLADLPGPLATPLRRELGLPHEALIVASAGRLSPEKNFPAMIEAARLVTREHPSAFFVVFGEGFLRQELEAKIEAAGLQGRFLLPGFRSDLQSALREIDVFMLPSFTEGLPNVVLEAFAVKKPVVATRVGGTPEVVTDRVSGYLTQPQEHEEMARHLGRLLADPGLRREMGEAGERQARESFGFETQTRLYQELYQKVAR